MVQRGCQETEMKKGLVELVKYEKECRMNDEFESLVWAGGFHLGLHERIRSFVHVPVLLPGSPLVYLYYCGLLCNYQ